MDDFYPSFEQILSRVCVVGQFSLNPDHKNKFFLFKQQATASLYTIDDQNLIHEVGNSRYESFQKILDPRHPAIESGPLTKDSWFYRAGQQKRSNKDDLFAAAPGDSILKQLTQCLNDYVSLMWSEFADLVDDFATTAGYTQGTPLPAQAIETFMQVTFDERMPDQKDRIDFAKKVASWRGSLKPSKTQKIDNVRGAVRIAGSEAIRWLLVRELFEKVMAPMRAKLTEILNKQKQASTSDKKAADFATAQLKQIQTEFEKNMPVWHLTAFEWSLLFAIVTGQEKPDTSLWDKSLWKGVFDELKEQMKEVLHAPAVRLDPEERVRREKELVQIFEHCLKHGKLPTATTEGFKENTIVIHVDQHGPTHESWKKLMEQLPEAIAELRQNAGDRTDRFIEDVVKDFRATFVPRCLGDAAFSFRDLARLFADELTRKILQHRRSQPGGVKDKMAQKGNAATIVAHIKNSSVSDERIAAALPAMLELAIETGKASKDLMTDMPELEMAAEAHLRSQQQTPQGYLALFSANGEEWSTAGATQRAAKYQENSLQLAGKSQLAELIKRASVQPAAAAAAPPRELADADVEQQHQQQQQSVGPSSPGKDTAGDVTPPNSSAGESPAKPSQSSATGIPVAARQDSSPKSRQQCRQGKTPQAGDPQKPPADAEPKTGLARAAEVNWDADDPIMKILTSKGVTDPTDETAAGKLPRGSALRDLLQFNLKELAKSGHVTDGDKHELALAQIIAMFSGKMFREDDPAGRLQFALLLKLVKHQSLDKFLKEEPLSNFFPEQDYLKNMKIFMEALQGDEKSAGVFQKCDRNLTDMRMFMSELYGMEFLLKHAPAGAEILVFNGTAEEFKTKIETENLHQQKGLVQYFSPSTHNEAFCLPCVILLTHLAFGSRQSRDEFLGIAWDLKHEKIPLNLPPLLLNVGQESGYSTEDGTDLWQNDLPNKPPAHDLVFFVGPHQQLRNHSHDGYKDPYITVVPAGYMVLSALLGNDKIGPATQVQVSVESDLRLISLHQNKGVSDTINQMPATDRANLRLAISLFSILNYCVADGLANMKGRLQQFRKTQPSSAAGNSNVNPDQLREKKAAWRVQNADYLGWQFYNSDRTLLSAKGKETELWWLDDLTDEQRDWFDQRVANWQ